MIAHILESHLAELVTKCGDAGVFVAMFLESSIIPIPSEFIIISAGAIGIPLVSIVLFGSLGSTLGGIVGYSIGRYVAMPVILKFGRYIFIQPRHIHKAEAFAKKYGAPGVLIGRVLPVVPFKVFSIASGLTNVPFIPFVICTLVGVVPRMYLLAVFGTVMIKYKKEFVILFLSVIIIFLIYYSLRLRYHKKHSGKNCPLGRE